MSRRLRSPFVRFAFVMCTLVAWCRPPARRRRQVAATGKQKLDEVYREIKAVSPPGSRPGS